jgi:CheY-like chemotaxis protein
VLGATTGEAALALALEHRPEAIVLDLGLPDVDGMVLLQHLKRHPDTRHIPVQVVSASGRRRDAMAAGAVGYCEKPLEHDSLLGMLEGLEHYAERGSRTLLVVEDDDGERRALAELLGGDDIEIAEATTAADALTALRERRVDCIVLDLGLSEGGGFGLLEEMAADERLADVPVIVHTGRQLTRKEETKLKRYARTIVVKDAGSPERLLDETSLYLHRAQARLPADKRRLLEQLHAADPALAGRTILVVDDDVRNIYAVSSALEAKGMRMLYAENGKDGLEALERHPEVDLVLMDVMMPEMDGYEATRRIRTDPRFAALPIIALTAKAMKGDREKSIAAGASDYITKPLDVGRLVALMRVWLHA